MMLGGKKKISALEEAIARLEGELEARDFILASVLLRLDRLEKLTVFDPAFSVEKEEASS